MNKRERANNEGTISWLQNNMWTSALSRQQELETKPLPCGFEVEELIPLFAGIHKVVVGAVTAMELQEGNPTAISVGGLRRVWPARCALSTGASNVLWVRISPPRWMALRPAASPSKRVMQGGSPMECRPAKNGAER